MICSKCDKDLAECDCPDLHERFESILKVPQLHIGQEYQARIRANIEKKKKEQSKNP